MSDSVKKYHELLEDKKITPIKKKKKPKLNIIEFWKKVI